MPETERIVVFLNGFAVYTAAGSTVGAALLNARDACRVSIAGEARTALCGMGICFECRATVDGVPHRRTCQLAARDGMRVETGA